MIVSYLFIIFLNSKTMQPSHYSQYLPPEIKRELLDRLDEDDFIQAWMTPGFANVCTEQYIFNRIRRKFRLSNDVMNKIMTMYNNSNDVTTLELYEVVNFINGINGVERSELSRFSPEVLENTIVLATKIMAMSGKSGAQEYLTDMINIMITLANDKNFTRGVLSRLYFIMRLSYLGEKERSRVQELISFIEEYYE